MSILISPRALPLPALLVLASSPAASTLAHLRHHDGSCALSAIPIGTQCSVDLSARIPGVGGTLQHRIAVLADGDFLDSHTHDGEMDGSRIERRFVETKFTDYIEVGKRRTSKSQVFKSKFLSLKTQFDSRLSIQVVRTQQG
ncbi:hypothetical protein EV127DRAFT_501598 [Xylaria flabelliformis]|nr:hypothetical protein EV127DRAFT_501598 [Xylaria flabelliformis]